jgi:hypothetical protein
MRGRVNLNGRTEEREVADLDHAHVEDDAVEVEEDPLAKLDVGAVVAEERRLHPDRLPALAEEFDQDGAAGVLVPFTSSVQVLAQVPGSFSRSNQFAVEWIVEFPG